MRIGNGRENHSPHIAPTGPVLEPADEVSHHIASTEQHLARLVRKVVALANRHSASVHGSEKSAAVSQSAGHDGVDHAS